MSESKRQVYFGTIGKPGHYARALNGAFSYAEGFAWMTLDTLSRVRDIEKAGEYYRDNESFLGSLWSVYAVPWSVDDSRGGCHTEFRWEGHHTLDEMLDEIRNNEFLQRQFGANEN